MVLRPSHYRILFQVRNRNLREPAVPIRILNERNNEYKSIIISYLFVSYRRHDREQRNKPEQRVLFLLRMFVSSGVNKEAIDYKGFIEIAPFIPLGLITLWSPA